MRVWRWIRWPVFALVATFLSLLAPVAYVEIMCHGTGLAAPFAPQIAPEHHRPETRTLMTYPEWHIVHAYEDYAETIRRDDPHDYDFIAGIGGFWSSLCALNKQAAAHGVVDGDTKQMVYVIGVSFTAELALKALYEETLGRLIATLRGPERAALDDLSADQAAGYAAFLQQVTWYKWPFREDAAALQTSDNTLRDRERRLALGLEYRGKATYADVIARAVAAVGADELTLRMIVSGTTETALAQYDGVRVIRSTPVGIEVATPRYRTLTHLLQRMAADGVDFVEIAGNDDILFTALSGTPIRDDAVFSTPRQGFGDHRHLIMVKVSDLAAQLRAMNGLRLEHIHDY